MRAFGKAVMSIPHAYATILFSDNIWLGLLLLCLSMVSPIVGLAGLAGVIVAILFSRVIGYENWDSASGVLSFNSLLISWSVAYYYPLNRLIHQPLELLVIVTIAAILGQILYIILSHWTQSAFKLPSMSLAFSIVALIIWFYLAKTGMLVSDLTGKPLLFELKMSLSPFWQQFFVSLGSIFFSPHVLSGMVVAVVILLISRLGAGLSLLGWTLCYYLSRMWSVNGGGGMYYPGVNVILTVMAVGGIFLLPGKAAWIIGLLAGAVTFLLSVAGNSIYYYMDNLHQSNTALPVPVFALPFNLVAIFTVYAMRFRLRAVNPVVNDTGVLHPEGALEHYLSRMKRFTRLGIPQFSLPITGEWTITQGHEGQHTHKLDWAYAWDFEIKDSNGQQYGGAIDQVLDYYGYSKPVLASAAGYVASVVTHVADNQPGSVNTNENWGNYVSISHGYGLWTLYAHLKKNSVTVKPGDYVNCGDKIGLVGNSGRSFVPHLHFQVQLGAEPGSRSKLSHLINYKVYRGGADYEFVGSGIPQEGDRISSLVSSKDPSSILGLNPESEQQFMVKKGAMVRSPNDKKGKHTRIETWRTSLDFWGRMKLNSNDGTTLEYSVYNGIYNALGLAGRKLNALTAFALVLSRMPYSERTDLYWKDTPGVSVVLGYLTRNLVLLLTPLINPVRVITHSRLTANRQETARSGTERIHIETRTVFHLFGIAIKTYRGEIELDSETGIRAIRLFKGNTLQLEAEACTGQNADPEPGIHRK
ncbi:MAG: urea transporter [Candidatus Cloacimonetes bacterium]|nr:urea transporter [Candidatus Cloacimonadota bacterium]